MLHTKKIEKIFLCIVFLVVQISCKKWMDINHDPNQATESNTTPDEVLPNALLDAVNFESTFLQFLNNWMGYWSPYADDPYINPEELSYNITNNFNSGYFTNSYINSSHFQYIDEKAAASNQGFYQGIAKIMKARNFAMLVDLYNNIPYQDAIQATDGYNNLGYLFPKYEDGKFIYEDILKQIDIGINLIKNTSIDKNIRITTTDIVFKGNKTKWIKFANTLKLRLLIHQAGRTDRSNYIQTEISKIVAEGTGFLDSQLDAAINPGFTSEFKQDNQYYAFYGFSYGFPTTLARANVFAMNILKENADPRLELFYKPIENIPGTEEPFSQPPPNNFRGNEYGLLVDPSIYPYQGAGYVSGIGGIIVPGPATGASTGIIKGYNMDYWLMTSVESLFLQAEAVQYGWINGDPKVAYMEAIKESFRWLNAGGNNADISLSDNVFLNWYNQQDVADNPNVSWDDAPEKHKLLLYQKYIALNGIQPLETWTDYRRNGNYPAIPLSADAGRTANTIPLRLLYPKSEYDLNTKNVSAEGTINQFTSKIWWMP